MISFLNIYSGFRIAEYNAFLQSYANLTVYSTSAEFASAHAEYARRYPAFAQRVRPFDPVVLRGAKLAWIMFLHNAHAYLPLVEAAAAPFVFSLYPGGAFGPNEPASDAMLDGVLASKRLRHIIVTQDITRAYLLARGVSPQKITLIYGGVMHARYVDEKAPIRAYYPKKPLLDVAFVAHKYMPQAPNKGFPDFCGLASNLAADPAIAWHVAGPVWVETDETGEVARRLVYRMQIERGVRTRFAVGYQIRDPDSGRLKDIVRYDDARGFFHRHNAGFPPGNDHIPINLPPGIDELEYIEADLDAHADEYEAEAVRLGYEVSEDDDETDP